MSLALQRPPLRQQRDTPDQMDGARIAYVLGLWNEQNAKLMPFHRTAEECLRMIAGQQWSMWSTQFNRFIDVEQWMTEDERRWRHRPVLNYLLPWFANTRARLTENPAKISWDPGPDRLDQELAETLTTITKVMEQDCDIIDVMDQVYGWMLATGEAYTFSRIDPTGGAMKEWIGQADLPVEVPVQTESGQAWQPLTDPNTGQPITQSHDDVPFGPDGQPLVRSTPNGLQPLDGDQPPVPHSARTGRLAVDVLPLFQVRGQWGNHVPWHQKAWHSRELFLTPYEVEELWGVKCQPDVQQSSDFNQFVDRVIFGSGHFGSSGSLRDAMLGVTGTVGNTDGYVRVRELWERPCGLPGMQETKQSPGGRLLIVTRDKVLDDGPRPLAFPYTSPIRKWEFLRVPGRPGGTTPVEMMLMPQRSLNRLTGAILEHTALNAAPKKVIFRGSGLEDIQITNRPDESITCTPVDGQVPIHFVSPPPLSKDVYQASDMLRQYLVLVGSVAKSPGESPTDTASGELVAQIRLDTDRFLGPTQRQAVIERSRMAEDMKVIAKVLYQQEQILTIAGDDNVVRTVLVQPHLFEDGNVNARPVLESNQPESRAEKQNRVRQLFLDGAWGPPATPEANEQYLEQSDFPTMGRALRPGGVNRDRAEYTLGRVMLGDTADQHPPQAWYQMPVQLKIFEQFMTRQEFDKLPDEVKGQVALLRMTYLQAFQLQQQQQVAEAANLHESSQPLTPPRPPPSAAAEAGQPQEAAV